FLIHGIVVARQDSHHLAPARADDDGRAHGIHHIDALGGLELPRPRYERPRPVRQRPHGAEIDDVGGELRDRAALAIGGDLHVLAAADRAELLHARHLGHVTHAAGTLDATRHRRLDQRSEVFLIDGALVFHVARTADAIGHRLVLQITLPTLVADRAIE